MTNKDWKQVIGSIGVFNEKAQFHILAPVKVEKMAGQNVFGSFIVMGIKKDKLLISKDGLWVSSVPKANVSIYTNVIGDKSK